MGGMEGGSDLRRGRDRVGEIGSGLFRGDTLRCHLI